MNFPGFSNYAVAFKGRELAGEGGYEAAGSAFHDSWAQLSAQRPLNALQVASDQ